MCLCVCLCVWCGVVCAVCCCVVWHAEKPPCVDSKRLSCVHSKRHVNAGNTRTCFSTCARGAGTHGDVLNVHTGTLWTGHKGSSPILLTKKSPRRVITCFRGSPKVTTGCCPCSSLRIDREQHVSDSSNHSLYLTKLLSSSYPGETLEGTSREIEPSVFRSHETNITNDLRVSIS